MVAGFNEALRNAAQVDLFTGIIPFLILFVLSYLALNKAPLIGDGNNSLVPLILGLLVSGLFSNFLIQNPVYQSFSTQFVGRLGLGLLFLIGVYIFLGFAPIENPLGDDGGVFIAILATLIALASFAGAGGLGLYLPDIMPPGLQLNTEGISEFIFEEGGWALFIPLAVVLYFLFSALANTDVGNTGNTLAEQLLGDLVNNNQQQNNP
jgi:hypothetical protein